MDALLDAAREFLARSGRLLERRMLATLFDDAPRAGALRALHAYQNDDGGFGWGLEPDKRTASSQPVDLQIALEALDLLDAFDVQWLPAALDSLPSISTVEGALPFATPAVADAPRADWWNVPASPPPSINPTGTVVGLLHKHHISHPWLAAATDWCWQAVEQLESAWFHDLMNAAGFLRYAPAGVPASNIGCDISSP